MNKKIILVNGWHNDITGLTESLQILKIPVISTMVSENSFSVLETSHVYVMYKKYENHFSYQGLTVDEVFYIDEAAKPLYRKNLDKDIFTGTVIDYIAKVEKESGEKELTYREQIKEQFELAGYGNDICELATNLCMDRGIDVAVLKTLLKKVEKEAKGEDSPEVVYVCDRHACTGQRQEPCDSIDCSHTHDIRHAVNFTYIAGDRWMENFKDDK